MQTLGRVNMTAGRMCAQESEHATRIAEGVRRVRILALATEAFGGSGGIAQYNRDFLTALASLDKVESVTVLPRMAADGTETPVHKVSQKPPIFGRVRYSAMALRFALECRPQVIVSSHLYHGQLALWLARLTGAKLISQLHGTEVWGRVARSHCQALEASDLVLAVSRHTRSKYLERCQTARQSVQVLPNTVGSEFTPGDRTAARARFDLLDDFAILTVGRLDARNGGYKGHGRIISLLPDLSAPNGRRITYLIAGDGDDRARLEDLTRSRSVEDRVRFLGKVPQRDLPDLYRAADLFAMPSTGEGFGIVFLEAMACGTPAIGLDVGGATDALANGKLGRCVSEADFPSALAHAIATAPPDPRGLSQNVRQRFGFPAFQAQVASVLESLDY